MTVARAVHYAHQHGILHRDLKPSNILMADGVPFLTDFGLAKRLDGGGDLTGTGETPGTPRYMAPEQAAGRKDLTVAADVYSLGVVLYERLTGTTPFQGDDLLDVLRQVREAEPPRPSSLRPGLDRDLETVCLKCLEKEPAKRYPSAEAIADDLEHWLRGEPILARPAGSVGRFTRWCRRNPVLAVVSGLAAAAVFVAIATGILFIATQAQSAADLKQALKTAEDNLDQAHEADLRKREADARKRQASQLAARLAFNQGIAQCQQDEVGTGMLWLARSLEIAPEDDADLQGLIRANLVAWHTQVNPLCGYFTDLNDAGVIALSPDAKILATIQAPGHGMVNLKGLNAEPKQRTIWEVHLWDLATGKPVGKPIQHSGIMVPFSRVIFRPDGKAILTLGWPARVWDVATGKPLSPPLPLEQISAVSAQFSADGVRLLAVGVKEIQLWDVATGKPVDAPFASRPRGNGLLAQFSPDGRLILTSGESGQVQLWDTATQKPLGTPFGFPGASDPVVGAAFSPDGRTLTMACGNAVAIWDIATRQPVNQLRLDDRTGPIVLSPNGELVAASAKDGCHIRRVRDGRTLGRPLPAPEGPAWPGFWQDLLGLFPAIAFSPDGSALLTSDMQTTRLWSVATGEALGPPLHLRDVFAGVMFNPDGKAPRCCSMAFDPEGRPVIAVRGPKAGTVCCRRIDRANPVKRISLPTANASAVAIQPGGQVVALGEGGPGLEGARDFALRLWDLNADKIVGTCQGHRDRAAAVAFSSDGHTIVTGSWDMTARLWDAATGRPLPVGPLKHSALVEAVAVSRDGRTILTGTRDGEAQLWDVTNGQRVGKSIRCPEPIRVMGFAPNGDWLLAGPQKLRRWDPTAGKFVGTEVVYPDPILALSPDGRTVLTATKQDGMPRLYEAATGKCCGLLLPSVKGVKAGAFSPDGRRVLLVSKEKATAYLWELAELQGTAERAVVWTQVLTGKELVENGEIRVLDSATWQERRRHLEELGGPPLPDIAAR